MELNLISYHGLKRMHSLLYICCWGLWWVFKVRWPEEKKHDNKKSAVTLFAKEIIKESKIFLRQQVSDFIMWNIDAFKKNSNMYTFHQKILLKGNHTCQRTKFSLITFRTASLLHTSLFNCWHGNSCTSWTFTKSHLLCSWPSTLA